MLIKKTPPPTLKLADIIEVSKVKFFSKLQFDFSTTTTKTHRLHKTDNARKWL